MRKIRKFFSFIIRNWEIKSFICALLLLNIAIPILEYYDFNPFKLLFENNKETMWIAIAGIDAAIGSTLPFFFIFQKNL